MKLNWNFLGLGGGGGGEVCKTKKTLHGVSMDTFWNCPFYALYITFICDNSAMMLSRKNPTVFQFSRGCFSG